MPRQSFLSRIRTRTLFVFDYERDLLRAMVVRHVSGMYPLLDPVWIEFALWLDQKNNGDPAIERLLDRALTGTTVTALLIGAETSNRKSVKYAVDQSIRQGNGMLGIFIHNIDSGEPEIEGINPLPYHYSTYNWIVDKGEKNLGKWVDSAKKGR
jgi:hypothetical protein